MSLSEIDPTSHKPQSMTEVENTPPQRRTLLQRLRDLEDSRGSGTIEKIFIIALFIFVAAAGLKILGTKTKAALEKQGTGIEQTGNTAAPN